MFGNDPVQNIGIIKDNICGSMVDVKPLRIEKGVVRGLHLQHGVDLFIRPACGGVRLYSSTSIACGFLYEEKQETILISCFIILDVIGSMIDFTQGVFFPSIRCFAIFQIDPLRFVPYIQFLEIHIFYEVRY